MSLNQKQIGSLIQLGHESGEMLREFFSQVSRLEVTHKTDQSPVTQADIAIHEKLIHALATVEDLPVLSEEASIPAFDERKKWSRYWVIDPLDGTKEFLRGVAEFTVNVALIEKGIPVFGLVVDPLGRRLFWGAKDQGTFCIEKDGQSRRLVGPIHRGSLPLRIIKSASDSLQLSQDLIQSQSPKPLLQSMGSSLKFALLADDQADLYLRDIPINEWDIAAGDAIWRYATESGASRPSPFNYNQVSLKILRFAVGSGHPCFEVRES